MLQTVHYRANKWVVVCKNEQIQLCNTGDAAVIMARTFKDTHIESHLRDITPVFVSVSPPPEIPSFTGQSFLSATDVLQTSEEVLLSMRIRAMEPSGLILFNGEAKDFFGQ